MAYKIVRRWFSGHKRTIKSGLTLEEAQLHCQNPQTSSRTCSLSRNKKVSRGRGAWFDGYTQE